MGVKGEGGTMTNWKKGEGDSLLPVALAYGKGGPETAN